ncbi:uncharacterized protein MELLADRAFT_87964 [Melampsora larici-populina 98AG31]|uniref:Uncharacterized protein n=1 Tax=Melampsora larici-populina (strain 98AG31 / pathotype 3-4-7) TaxID=747676 RepID=F4RQJ8_MELLP|nr:uncharacterized protein MELLADRAFT_87964 [Melampsora larici-populina 98AG31]EGG05501.1 hypothetical protein MELLADRAFT_87964 [Melampsora larici-populina 98AG31]
MVNNPYIGIKYQRLPSHPTLPLPDKGSPMGLACPECPNTVNVSLVYSRVEDLTKDTVTVNCPSAKHYIRTFKLNQLLHEIACINAGAKYPIPFDPSAHGPPVNVKGMQIPARISPKKTANPSSSNRTAFSVDCARHNVGPTAKGHKKMGHAGCTSVFCQSVIISYHHRQQRKRTDHDYAFACQCCRAFTAPGGCYVHRTTEPPPTHVNTDPLNTGPRPAPPANPPAAKRAKILPAQCAQSVRRVGRILTPDGQLVLAAARQEKSPAITPSKPSMITFDHSKVISLHLVCVGSQLPVISHFFKDWPVAVLNNSSSLIREAQAAAGAQWDEHLVVWDEEVRNWREIGVALPHSYTPATKNLIICLPHQRSTLQVELQDILETLGMGKPLVRNRSTDLGPTAIQMTLPKPSSSQDHPVGSNKERITISLLDSDSETDLPEISQSTSQSTASQPQMPAPSTPESLPVEDQRLLQREPSPKELQLSTVPSAADDVIKRDWPGKDVLISSLLAWYDSAGCPPRRTARMRLWKSRYGNLYTLAPAMVYRYAEWIDLVGYQRMYQWWLEWPGLGESSKENLTVAQTRPHFQKEFNAACGYKKEAEVDVPSKDNAQ